MNSEQNTFDRLRRVDYEVALLEYLSLFRYMRMDISIKELECIADPKLYILGWNSKILNTAIIKRRLQCK